MRRNLLSGPASDPSDGIIDAEFDEVTEDEAAHPTLPQRPPNYTIGEWLVDMHPAKAAVIVAILLATFIAFVMGVGQGRGSGDGPGLSVDTAASATTADQMLAEWSRHVTGQPSTSGFVLVDGSGAAGTSCDDGGGAHLLQFGRSGAKAPIISDFFSMQTAGSDIGVAGAFWFNNQTGELLVRNSHAVDLKRKKDWAVPDKIFQVGIGGDGTVQLDGVTYHFCVMTS